MKREEQTALLRTEFPRSHSSKKTLATLNVIDNLIAQKKIPVMIAVFINPGSPGTPTRNFLKAYSDKWHRPDRFSRVISWIGNYTSIQWKEDTNLPDDGQNYPRKSWRTQEKYSRGRRTRRTSATEAGRWQTFAWPTL